MNALALRLGVNRGTLAGLAGPLLIVLILLHRGKGGGLSSMFGGAVSSSLAGSSVVEKNLNRLTVFCAVIWAVCIVGLGILLKVS